MSFRLRQPYDGAMKDWLRMAAKNWDAVLAFTLFFLVIAIYGGPGYYFLVWWLLGSLYILHVALRR